MSEAFDFSEFFQNLFQESNRTILILAAVAAVSLIVIVIVLILLLKKRKKRKKEEALYSAETEEVLRRTQIGSTVLPEDDAPITGGITEEITEEADHEESEGLPSDEQNASEQSDPAGEMKSDGSADAEEPAIVLIGMGGYFGQKKITQKGIVILGRNPQRCSLVYPKEEKGISSVHCRVQRSAGRILLTDLGSQYGTFVNGQRLQSNVPFELQQGDTFWLADRVNSFYIM